MPYDKFSYSNISKALSKALRLEREVETGKIGWWHLLWNSDEISGYSYAGRYLGDEEISERGGYYGLQRNMSWFRDPPSPPRGWKFYAVLDDASLDNLAKGWNLIKDILIEDGTVFQFKVFIHLIAGQQLQGEHAGKSVVIYTNYNTQQLAKEYGQICIDPKRWMIILDEMEMQLINAGVQPRWIITDEMEMQLINAEVQPKCIPKETNMHAIVGSSFFTYRNDALKNSSDYNEAKSAKTYNDSGQDDPYKDMVLHGRLYSKLKSWLEQDQSTTKFEHLPEERSELDQMFNKISSSTFDERAQMFFDYLILGERAYQQSPCNLENYPHIVKAKLLEVATAISAVSAKIKPTLTWVDVAKSILLPWNLFNGRFFDIFTKWWKKKEYMGELESLQTEQTKLKSALEKLKKLTKLQNDICSDGKSSVLEQSREDTKKICRGLEVSSHFTPVPSTSAGVVKADGESFHKEEGGEESTPLLQPKQIKTY